MNGADCYSDSGTELKVGDSEEEDGKTFKCTLADDGGVVLRVRSG